MKTFNLLVTLVVLGALLSTLAVAAPGTGGSKQKALQMQRDRAMLEEEATLQMGSVAGPKATTISAGPRTVLQPLTMPTEPLLNMAALKGSYTIGAAGDFLNLGSAVAALNLLGIDSTVVFEFIDASYTEAPSVLGPIAGADSANTVTFRPAAATAVTVEFDAFTGYGKGLALMGAQFVTIDGVDDGGASLTFKYRAAASFPSGDAVAGTIYMGSFGTDVTSDITIKNMSIYSIADDSDWDLVSDVRHGIMIEGWDDYVYNVHIDSNKFGNAWFAVLAEFAYNITISNNEVGDEFASYTAAGFQVYGSPTTIITRNKLHGIQFNTGNFGWGYSTVPTAYVGWLGNPYMFIINAQSCPVKGEITYNSIYDVHMKAPAGYDTVGYSIYYGLRGVGSGVLHLVANNTMAKVYTTNDPAGYWAIRAQNSNVFNNTLYFDDTPQDPGAGGYMMLSFTSVVANVQNNVFYSETDALHGYLIGNHPTGSDYNVIAYPGASIAEHHAVGIDSNSSNGAMYFADTKTLEPDITKNNAAENLGDSTYLVSDDIAGTSRDAVTPDAGAWEFTSSNPTFTDIQPSAISSPDPNGTTFGLPASVVVDVGNNRPAAETYDLRVIINDGSTDVYDVTESSESLAGFATGQVTMSSTFTPADNATHTITAIVIGDDEVANDTISRAQPIVPLLAFGGSYSSCFNDSAGQFGWVGSGDFVLDSTFAKLTGPYDGESWVTKVTGNYSTGGLVSSVFSPFFDFSSVSDTIYVSFVHSIQLEPAWDRAQFQYSIDTGATWLNVGVLNDPLGTNWYDEGLYKNAATKGDCIDSVNVLPNGFNFGPAWASNGDCGDGLGVGETGPFGWIFAANALPVDVFGKPMVRFRYAFFSDAASSDAGCAFDCFELGTSPASFSGTISGTKWLDANGNGVNDAETLESGVEIELKYYGVTVGYDTTDGSGDYSFPVGAPGIYTIYANDGLAKTVPSPDFFWTVDHPGSGDTTGKDFGNFAGSISGRKFEDVNNNGADDSEPGLEGWTINVHIDSLSGDLYASAETDSTGAYSVAVPPGDYYVVEVAQAGSRQTLPDSGYYVTIGTTSGSGGANPTGMDFGNFLFSDLVINFTVDLNGDGNKIAGDIIPIDVGSASFSVKKGGVDISGSPFSIGDGVGSANISGLDTGTYVIAEETFIGGWIRTLSETADIVVTSSGGDFERNFMSWKMITLSGVKYEDVNGNGAQDSAEAGLEGWTVNVTGGTYYGDATATTDGDGNWTIDSVGQGSHTISEVVESGWTQTDPGGAGTYANSGTSGNLNTQDSDLDFGNFENATVSGIVYRDYNGNGVMDVGDSPMSGVTVDLLANGGSDVSDGSGYSFNGLITTDTVVVTVPGGFVITQPGTGDHYVALTSGGSATGLHFGLFQTSDSASKYRTFTAAQLGADDQKKAGKAPKVGKVYDPIKNKPNTSNMTTYLFDPKKGLGLPAQVGLAGQLNAGGKEKGYMLAGKGGDIWKSLNKKSVQHTGMARGMDLDLKGKVILKRFKSFPPNKKQNNKLFAELLALEVNLVASGINTPAGLGSLIYSDPLSSLDGMTIDEIKAYADSQMTLWEWVPLGVYTELDSVVAKINGAFATGATDDTLDGWSVFPGVKYPPLTWVANLSVQDVPFLNPNPGVSPKNRHVRMEQDIPTAFELYQNYPNPFNPTTTISFDLPDESIVTLKVYNLLGQEIATLLDREIMDLGDEVEFDAAHLPSGVYLYRFVAETLVDPDEGGAAETFTQVKKMVLLK